MYVTVPKNFEFDGASIPRFFWRVIGTPFAPDVIIAALVHDYLYKHGHELGISRKEADTIFRSILRYEGHPKADTMYRTLRMFGASNYKKSK